MIKIPLEGYNPDTYVVIEDEEGSVYLSGSEQSIQDADHFGRNLTPAEARAVASTLWHYAKEAQR